MSIFNMMDEAERNARLLASYPTKEIPMFQIEKNVRPPVTAKKYPFAEMDIGDSFLAHGVKRASLDTATYQYAKESGRKFSIRATPDGARVWRVK